MRRFWVSMAVVAFVALVSFAGLSPASARSQQLVRITEGVTIERSYGPIPGNFPTAPTLNWTPPGCADGATGSATCDLIPLDIVVPKLGPVDDFFVTLEISWDDPAHANDIDIYLWDNEQVKRSQGSTGYTRLTYAATSNNPERIKLFVPTMGRYNLTVVNFAGPNVGYKFKASMTVIAFNAPFESLAPDFRPPSESSVTPEQDAVAPFDYSTPPSDGGSGPAAPAFGEIAVLPDADLDFGPSDFDGALAAPPPLSTGIRSELRPPRPVAGVIAFFWLGVVPAVLTGAGAAFVLRRRTAAFGF